MIATLRNETATRPLRAGAPGGGEANFGVLLRCSEARSVEMVAVPDPPAAAESPSFVEPPLPEEPQLASTASATSTQTAAAALLAALTIPMLTPRRALRSRSRCRGSA